MRRDLPYQPTITAGRRGRVAAEMITVLLGDDHAVVRDGTRQILERDDSITVVGEAADGAEVVRLARQLAPDVVLLDVALPVLNGIEATREIRSGPGAPYVLLLSAYDDQDYVVAAIAAGASGYLLKTASALDVMAAIRAVVRGEVVLHPMLARRLAARSRDDVDVLTDREREVIQLAAGGMSNKQIADTLSLSTRTVEAHFTSVFNRLGVANRTEAIATAAHRGWLRREGGGP
jgi:two-component system, NarL family, response regulator LiaR